MEQGRRAPFRSRADPNHSRGRCCSFPETSLSLSLSEKSVIFITLSIGQLKFIQNSLVLLRPTLAVWRRRSVIQISLSSDYSSAVEHVWVESWVHPTALPEQHTGQTPGPPRKRKDWKVKRKENPHAIFPSGFAIEYISSAVLWWMNLSVSVTCGEAPLIPEGNLFL